MTHKTLIEVQNGSVVHEFDVWRQGEITLSPVHMDVTDRTDGPFIGKLYDAVADTFSDPPPPPEEPSEEPPDDSGQQGN